MNVLVIDNYDSFVYNLVHMLKSIGVESVDVVRNDRLDESDVSRYDKVLISPGPGIPSEAGLMPATIKAVAPMKSILGVCLGHQAIAECFGATLRNLSMPLHGIATQIDLTRQDYLFEGLPGKIRVGHYHSWVVEGPLPDELEATASDEQGHIMAVRHVRFDVRGVQFHPESVLTEQGDRLLRNWINHSL